MPKASKGTKFYAVKAGRQPGVYDTWDECQTQVTGFRGAKFKSFPTAAEAQAFAFPDQVLPSGAEQVLGPAAASTSATATTSRRTHAKKPYEKNTTVTAPKSFNAFVPTEVDETGWDVVYTDGACKNNQGGGAMKRAGVGVWWGPGDERNIAERCPGEQTNNRAELMGIIRALETVPHTKKPLMIKTDSKYSIKCFEEWIKRWVMNGWKTSDGKPTANAPLIRYASALLDERARLGQKVRFVHVAGHVGIEGNEGADDLANKGCWLAEVNVENDWDRLERELRARQNALGAQRRAEEIALEAQRAEVALLLQRTTVNHIAAPTSVNHVAASTRVDHIAVSTRLNHVVVSARANRIATSTSVDHIVALFERHPQFDYDPTKPVMDEWRRMCNELGLNPDDTSKYEVRVQKRELKTALVRQFNIKYGMDVNDLAAWQNLCRTVDIPVPDTLYECQEAIRGTHVNLVDLVDLRDGEVPTKFATEMELSKYTLITSKIFPREHVQAGGLLCVLLRHIMNPRREW